MTEAYSMLLTGQQDLRISELALRIFRQRLNCLELGLGYRGEHPVRAAATMRAMGYRN